MEKAIEEFQSYLANSAKNELFAEAINITTSLFTQNSQFNERKAYFMVNK